MEHINRGKLGIRVNLLREQGIETVWQLSRKSFQQLCTIDGLGEQSVRKIQDTVKQILENTKKTARIRIQAENPGEVEIFSDRNETPTSNHSLLANALETAVQNDTQRQKLRDYKDKIRQIEADEQKQFNVQK